MEGSLAVAPERSGLHRILAFTTPTSEISIGTKTDVAIWATDACSCAAIPATCLLS